MSAAPCSPETCTLDTHDHHDEDGSPMLCADCNAPTHYDLDVEDYRHDDPAAKPCWLVPGQHAENAGTR